MLPIYVSYNQSLTHLLVSKITSPNAHWDFFLNINLVPIISLGRIDVMQSLSLCQIFRNLIKD